MVMLPVCASVAPHPRLFGGETEFAAIREKAKTEPLIGAAMKGIAVRAADYAASPPLSRKMDGRRLLKVSREALALLEHALGTDEGLSEVSGFLATGDFLDWTTGPTGEMFNYSDSGLRRQATTASWWFAAHGLPTCVDFFERGAVLAAVDRPEGLPRTFPCALFWMLNVPKAESVTRPRIWSSDDPTGIVTMRTDQTTNAWFVAFKGGLVGANHGHLDVGSFVFEADGVRWAGDLGSEGYGRVEAAGLSLWNMSQSSDRWKLYRLNNESHNVLCPEGVLQNARSSGRVVSARDTGTALEAEFNLDAIYAPTIKGWTRRARLTVESLAITDEVRAGTSDAVVWGFSTQAKATVVGDAVVLRASDRVMKVKASGAEGAVWKVGPAEGRHPVDSRNQSWSRVLLLLPHAENLRFTVRFDHLERSCPTVDFSGAVTNHTATAVRFDP